MPPSFDYGGLMAVGYYVIGQIQKQNPPYFKQSILSYADKASKQFGEKINPMVE